MQWFGTSTVSRPHGRADLNELTRHYDVIRVCGELRRLADECATRYRHVIVYDDDIPFEQDGWRDNEVWRGRMQGMVLHDLASRRIPFHVVSGSLDERVARVRSILGGAAVSAHHARRAT